MTLSVLEKSQGWHLLYDLLITAALKENIVAMTLDDIQQSVHCFNYYELSLFNRYYHDILKLGDE